MYLPEEGECSTRINPSTGLPLLPRKLRTPNELWMYQNLVEVNKKNEELKKTVSTYGKAISTLLRIAKRLTPKPFRSRSNKEKQPMEEIEEFIQEYGDDDEEAPIDEGEHFYNNSPARHSFQEGDTSTHQEHYTEVPSRHSIHDMPRSSNTRHTRNEADPISGLKYARKRRPKPSN